MKYFQTVIKSIYSPLKTFRELSYSNKSIKYGWISTIGFAVMYTATAIILAATGWLPFTEPILPISPERYYFFQSFFTIPVGILGVGLSYLIAIGLLRLFSIKIKTQKLWGPISIASVLPSFFFMWAFETFVVALLYSPNSWSYLTFDLFRILIGTIWTVILTIIAIKSVENTKWWQCIIIGTISSGIMGTLMGICYR
jgi:hypothetical protein